MNIQKCKQKKTPTKSAKDFAKEYIKQYQIAFDKLTDMWKGADSVKLPAPYFFIRLKTVRLY